MPKRGENIYKRKDGRWEGRYIKGHTDDGKAVYGFAYAKTYYDVKKKIEDVKNEHIKTAKKDAIEETPRVADITFKDIAEQWYDYISINAKKSTSAKYRNFLDNHILSVFGKYPIEEIQTTMVEQFALYKLQNGRLDGGGGLSPKTVKDMLSVIREVIFYAEKRHASVSCSIRDIHIKQTETTLQIISKENQEKLENYLLMNESLRNIGILMSLYMGIRIGELCALKWKHILIKKGVVQIRSTMQRIQTFTQDKKTKTDVVITPPKSTCAIRDIPIPLFLSELLDDYDTNNNEAFLLTGKENIFLEPRTFQYYFRKVLKDNNIPPVNYHVLRHTFATRCIEKGFDMKSLSEILGHSTVNITLNRYVHTSMEMKRKNMLRISEPLSYSPSETQSKL